MDTESMGMMISSLLLHAASGTEDAGTEAVTEAIAVEVVAVEEEVGGRGGDDDVVLAGGSDGT